MSFNTITYREACRLSEGWAGGIEESILELRALMCELIDHGGESHYEKTTIEIEILEFAIKKLKDKLKKEE